METNEMLEGLKVFDENVDNYTEADRYEDLLTFSKRLEVQNRRRMDSWISRQAQQRYVKYNDEQVKQFLQDPRAHEKELRQLSRQLENTSQIYQRIVGYLPSLAIINPIILPTYQAQRLKTIDVQYEKAMEYLTLLNLPKELLKVYRTVFREDVFYGLEYESEDMYSIRQLDPDYCRISGVEHGAYTYQMDMTFFCKTKNYDVDTTLLAEYDQYIDGFFTKAFNNYRKDGSKQWVDIPAQNSICIKLKEELDYCYPPYASIYKDIQSIEDFKALNKIAEEQANYKIIGFKIPTFSGNNAKNNQQDAFSIKVETATMFYELARTAIADSIGIFYSPMDWDSVNFNDGTTNTRNRVKESTDQLYDSLGISRLVFNSDNATTLQYSIKCDEALLFALNRQIETWITRKFIYKHKGNFVCEILDLTIFNRKDMADTFLKGAQSGVPTVVKTWIAMGGRQENLMAYNFLQNNILKVQDNFIPLSTSYTQSSKDSESGRPTEENPNSEVTIENRNRGTDAEKTAMNNA